MIEVEIPGFADLKRRSGTPGSANVSKRARFDTEEDVRYAATALLLDAGASSDRLRRLFFDNTRRNSLKRRGSDVSAHTSNLELLRDLDDEDGAAIAVGPLLPAPLPPIKAAMNPCHAFPLLSPHLHVYIFRFLTEPRQLRNIKMANRLWHHLGEENVLWETIAPPTTGHASLSSSPPPLAPRPVAEPALAAATEESAAQPQAMPYISIRSRDQLAKLWHDASVEAKRQDMARLQGQAGEAGSLIDEVPSPPPAPRQRTKSAGLPVQADVVVAEASPSRYLAGLQSSDSIAHDDAHHCYIRATLRHMECSQASAWGCMYKGWEWLRTEFRAALRHVWRQELESGRVQTYNQTVSKQRGMHRAFNKLFRNDWAALYQCMKDELRLQAQCMARDICVACPPVTRGTVADAAAEANDALRLLELVCKAFHTFSNWVADMEEVLWRIDERLSNEESKLRSTTSRSTQLSGSSPLLRDLAMLAFRNEVLFYCQLHSRITCAIAVIGRALEAGESRRLTASASPSMPTTEAAKQPRQPQQPARQQQQQQQQLYFTDEELTEDYISRFASDQHHAERPHEGARPERVGAPSAYDKDQHLKEGLVQLYQVLLQLDLPDDETAAAGRKTHGAMRRLFLIPLRQLEQISHDVREADTEHQRQHVDPFFEDALADLCQSDYERCKRRRSCPV